MTMRLVALIGLLLVFTTGLLAQPELVEGGGASDSGKMGTAVASGEGFLYLALLVGRLTLDVEGDLLVSATVKITIDGEEGEKTIPTLVESAAFLGNTNDKLVVKPKDTRDAVVKPSRNYLYTGLKGKVTISGNRFLVGFRGKVTGVSIYGMGQMAFLGNGKYSVSWDGQPAQEDVVWAAQPADETQRWKALRAALVPCGEYPPAKKKKR